MFCFFLFWEIRALVSRCTARRSWELKRVMNTCTKVPVKLSRRFKLPVRIHLIKLIAANRRLRRANRCVSKVYYVTIHDNVYTTVPLDDCKFFEPKYPII